MDRLLLIIVLIMSIMILNNVSSNNKQKLTGLELRNQVHQLELIPMEELE